MKRLSKYFNMLAALVSFGWILYAPIRYFPAVDWKMVHGTLPMMALCFFVLAFLLAFFSASDD